MATIAPKLSSTDLKVELERFHAEPHRTLHTAFFGTGEPDRVKVHIRAEDHVFKVVPVDCELRLREVLSDADSDPLVLLVDYTDRLPLDIQGRLAQGNLKFISRERRLANLFGAKAVAPSLLDSPLGDALLQEGRPFAPPVEGTTVDEHTAWRRQLERMVGLSHGSDLSEELIVEHFARQPRRPDVVKLCEENPSFAQAVRAYLRTAAGPIAELAWERWLEGSGLEVAGLAFLLEPLLEHVHNDYVHGFLEAQLGGVRKDLTPEQAGVLTRWGALAVPLALRMGNAGGMLERVLAEADRRVEKKSRLSPFLLASRHLSAGFAAAKQQLATALQTAIKGVGSDGRGAVQLEDVRAVVDAHQRLSRHRLAGLPAQEPIMERILMAVRLLAYLATRSELEGRLVERVRLEVAYELADHYATEGGFVDFARRAARGGVADDELSVALDRVLAAADAFRDSLDARFGPALGRWNIERKSGRLIPIERGLDALGVDFLGGGADRRLLVLVMDGMAWCTAVEILLDLRDAHWAPLRWQAEHASSTRMPAPMIAALPTMTDVSRAALFAGRLLRVGEALDTKKDPDRLSEHRGFEKAFGQGPRLLLRTEAEDNAGHLTKDARELVRSKDRVVALVVNAVDDMLSAKPGFRGRYNRETIKALAPALDAAREAGRAVLLIADHGHVLSDRETDVVKVDGADKVRFRELTETMLASERELVLEPPNVYCSRKDRRLAILVGEAQRYKDARNLGEHGGASLAEVVTPALLIGADDLYQAVGDGEDAGLETVSFPVPPWWNLELPAKAKPASADVGRPGAASKPSRPPATSTRQLDIFEKPKEQPAEPPAKVRSSRPPASPWAKRLDAVYAKEGKARRDDLQKRVLPMLDILLEHGGRMSDEVLAGKLGEATRNISARVAIMAEFVNLDAYEVIRHNPTAKQVELDEGLLRELFEEKS